MVFDPSYNKNHIYYIIYLINLKTLLIRYQQYTVYLKRTFM